MCEDPCDKLKYSVCQYEKGCDGPFLMPCSSTCFEFNNHWPERQPVNYTIAECASCSKNSIG